MIFSCIHIHVESARLGLSTDGILHCNTMTLSNGIFFLCHTIEYCNRATFALQRSEIVFDDSINYDSHRNCIIWLSLAFFLFHSVFMCSSTLTSILNRVRPVWGRRKKIKREKNECMNLYGAILKSQHHVMDIDGIKHKFIYKIQAEFSQWQSYKLHFYPKLKTSNLTSWNAFSFF